MRIGRWFQGIRGRLWLAFLTVSAMTVLATGIAFYAFNISSASLYGILDQRVPGILQMTDLSQAVSQVVSDASQLPLARSRESLRARWAELNQRLTRVDLTLDAALGASSQALRPTSLSPSASPPPGQSDALRQMSRQVRALQDSLESLVLLMDEVLRLRQRYSAQLEQVDILNQEYRLLISTLESDRGGATDLLTEMNRVMVTLGQVSRQDNEGELEQLEHQYMRSFRVIEAILSRAETDPLYRQSTHSILVKMRAVSVDRGGLFDLKRRERDTLTMVSRRMQEVQLEAFDLDRMAQRQVETVNAAIAAERSGVADTLFTSRLVLGLAALISVAAAILIGWRYVGLQIVGRVQAMAATMRSIAGGTLDAPIPAGDDDELGEMGRALVVFRDALVNVRHMATHDSLTGLAGRRLCEDRLARRIAGPSQAPATDDTPDSATRSARPPGPQPTSLLPERGTGGGAVIYINLCDFKDINDTFGHAVGDRVLLAVSDRLRWLTGDDTRVARMGGDEFAIIVPGLQDSPGLSRPLFDLLETLLRTLSAPVPLERMDIDPQPALGVAFWTGPGDSAAAVIRNSELAMKTAMRDSQTRYALYHPDMGEQITRRQLIRAELRPALEDQQFALLYQPKVAMATGRISGVEALVRWNHPQRGQISPADFIPVAERSGLIVELGSWVLQEACRQARHWQERGHPLRMAVNMSPVQVLRHDVVSTVRQALDITGLPPDLLEIEITEGVLLNNESRALSRLRALRDLGVRLAIDDFGTGYSSLSYLKQLPVTCLKIDQSFVRGLEQNPEDARLSRVIIGMAHDFGLEVVAEGIETDSHASFLQQAGCDFGQGYHYSRPVAASVLTSLLEHPLPWHLPHLVSRRA